MESGAVGSRVLTSGVGAGAGVRSSWEPGADFWSWEQLGAGCRLLESGARAGPRAGGGLDSQETEPRPSSPGARPRAGGIAGSLYQHLCTDQTVCSPFVESETEHGMLKVTDGKREAAGLSAVLEEEGGDLGEEGGARGPFSDDLHGCHLPLYHGDRGASLTGQVLAEMDSLPYFFLSVPSEAIHIIAIIISIHSLML